MALSDFHRQTLDSMGGADTVRNMLMAGTLASDWREPAALYLAEIDAKARADREDEARRQSAVANSTKIAAWVAAALALATLVVELLRR